MAQSGTKFVLPETMENSEERLETIVSAKIKTIT